ncbi:GB1/RHD3-type G domain-containing protein [Aphelenchoides besseyi]|nr:GB1/RHD3-type G domain-containing protein [Aphelenchoides besseyi]KAI6224114.1 GB1/RHD3-type G domain-containing protein [Aphelenchoides besseyi]
MSDHTNIRDFGISQLVHINDKDECVWNLGPLLRVLEDPKHANYSVSALGVCGKLRTGKSTLQNHDLRHLAWIAMGTPQDVDWKTIRLKNEFKAAASDDAVTKGIWICPFVIEQQKQIVIVVDVEGAFDPKANAYHSQTLFAISTMLSNTLIYNIKNQIGADDLENLERFLKYAQNANGGEKVQEFCFLIRDYQGNLDYGFEGGREFMTNWRKKASPENHVYLEVVENSTQELKCCLIPRPEDAGIKSGVLAEIGSEFVQVSSAFVEQTVANLKSTMNSVQSATLLKRLPEVFKTGNLPPVESVYELLYVKPVLVEACIATRCDTKKSMEIKTTGEIFLSACDKFQEYALRVFEDRYACHCTSKHFETAKSELIRGMNEDFVELEKLNDLKRSNREEEEESIAAELVKAVDEIIKAN